MLSKRNSMCKGPEVGWKEFDIVKEQVWWETKLQSLVGPQKAWRREGLAEEPLK